jgi:hypothetical protein
MPLLGLDVAIARSGFIFNLSPNATGCVEPIGPPILSPAQCHGSPQEAALFDAVMAGLNASVKDGASLPAIYGWTEPETDYTLRVSAGGCYVLCSGAPNLSFWAYFAIAPNALKHAFGRVARAASPPTLPPLEAKTCVFVALSLAAGFGSRYDWRCTRAGGGGCTCDVIRVAECMCATWPEV